MPNLLRNSLAVVGGIVIGSVVNMALITVGPTVIPPPAGVDLSTPEGLSAAMQLFEPRHFLVPFLAHALGTLVGAIAAYLIAGSHKETFAYVIGAVFLCGGVAASFKLTSPSQLLRH